MPKLPECCLASEGDPLAKILYAVYNRGGDASTAGLNFQGKPCPEWTELPENVRAKWEAVAALVLDASDVWAVADLTLVESALYQLEHRGRGDTSDA